MVRSETPSPIAPGGGDPWPQSWTRAALELTVLALIAAHGPTHGYDLARRLAAAGLGEIKGGTLYPVLNRLEDQGLVEGVWVAGAGGPGRKLVTATEAGRTQLAERTARWRQWSVLVGDLLTDTTGHRPPPPAIEEDTA